MDLIEKIKNEIENENKKLNNDEKLITNIIQVIDKLTIVIQDSKYTSISIMPKINNFKISCIFIDCSGCITLYSGANKRIFDHINRSMLTLFLKNRIAYKKAKEILFILSDENSTFEFN